MQDDRLAQSQRIYFNQAESLFLMARGFFRWPSISAQPSSAAISNALYLSYLYILYVQVGEGITICYLTQLLNTNILGHCCLWKVYSVLTIEDTEHH